MYIIGEPHDWGSSAHKIIKFDYNNVMEYSKDFVLNSGGNRVATDGVDNYGQIKGLRFGSHKFMVIVFY